MREFCFVALMITAAVLSSCVQEMSLDSGERQKVVVNCLLKEGDIQTLELYYSSGSPTEEHVPVENADVLLSYYYNNEFVTKFHHDSGCVWSASHTPTYGRMYKLSVIIDGDTLSARTLFPDNIQIRGDLNDSYQNSLCITYDLCTVKKNVIGLNDTIPYEKDSRLWIFPHDLGGGNRDRYIGTSHRNADNFNLLSLFVKDMNCFSDDSLAVMDPIITSQINWYSDLFPYIQLHDFFVRIEHPGNYNNGVSSDDLSSSPYRTSRDFMLVRDFPTRFSQAIWREELVTFRIYDIYILSEDADAYYRDVYHHHLNQDNFIFQYDSEGIYSNVDGGVGIFGAAILRYGKIYKGGGLIGG